MAIALTNTDSVELIGTGEKWMASGGGRAGRPKPQECKTGRKMVQFFGCFDRHKMVSNLERGMNYIIVAI